MTHAGVAYPVKEVVKDTINGVPSEIAIYDSTDRLVGYWSFGNYDPELPFHGNDLKPRKDGMSAAIFNHMREL